MNPISVAVFVILFAFVTGLGFFAARWRRGDLDRLDEWGLGGRRFGTFIAWFLLGGDLYTAYTFVAVPALMFGAGAFGFFAVPYTIIVYPLVYLVFPRLWNVCHRHGYVTASDFVRGRYGNRWLALAVALTGLVATMPYIALQLVGLQVVLAGLGLSGDWPLVIAFILLAAFTYTSGLRAPAMIAVVKDLLIYLVVIAAVVVVPIELGGYGAIFAKIPAAKLLLPVPKGASFGFYSAYATLALGSAIALFFYPHSVTGVLSASSAKVVRRNAALLPAYTLVLGLLALFGFMAIAAGVAGMPRFKSGFDHYHANYAVPALILVSFPPAFAGVAFAAIAIGALVPAAVMSIASANLFTRDIYRPFLRPDCTPVEETRIAKFASLVVKAGALLFIVALPVKYAIQLQLLGGILIIQTVPTVLFGLYTRFFHPFALLAGWTAGMAIGIGMFIALKLAGTIYPLHAFGLVIPGYAALYSVVANVVISAVLSPLFAAFTSGPATDETAAADYG